MTFLASLALAVVASLAESAEAGCLNLYDTDSTLWEGAT